MRCLQRGDQSDSIDIVGATAAGQVVRRPCESLQDGSDGRRAAEPFDELDSDITGGEVGKDQNVRPPCHRGIGGFRLGNSGDDGGVGLEFAIHRVTREPLTNEGGSRGNPIDTRVGCTLPR